MKSVCLRLFIALTVAFSFVAESFAEQVVVIKLRTPNTISDARFDPYYELGEKACFGATGCHRSNIMNPKTVYKNLVGFRAAFVQNGINQETGVSEQRLIMLTPVIQQEDILILGSGEDKVALLRWNGNETPALAFSSAPVVISNNGEGIQELISAAEASKRSTLVAAFGSQFRSRVKPLSEVASNDLVKLWESALNDKAVVFAESYAQTMSPPPRTVDTKRSSSLSSFIARAKGCRSVVKGKH